MQISCYIYFTSGQYIEVSVDTLRKWCPLLLHHLNPSSCIDISGLVYEIGSDLALRTSKPFSQDATAKVLKKLFKHWDASPLMRDPTPTRMFLNQTMVEQLQEDGESQRLLGLGHARHRFLVYCLLAKHTWSTKLAEAMMDFFQLQELVVLENEKQKFLVEWCWGILQLRGLISEHTIREILYTASEQGRQSWNGWQGSKKPTSLLEWTLLQMMLDTQQEPSSPSLHQRSRIGWRDEGRRDGSRASSLPPSASRRDLGRLVGPAHWNQPGTMSNPAWSNFVDRVNQLHWHQEEMNLKLDSIDRKLDCLIDN